MILALIDALGTTYDQLYKDPRFGFERPVDARAAPRRGSCKPDAGGRHLSRAGISFSTFSLIGCISALTFYHWVLQLPSDYKSLVICRPRNWGWREFVGAVVV